MIKIRAYIAFMGFLIFCRAATAQKDSISFELKPGLNPPIKGSDELRKSSVTVFLSKDGGIMLSYKKNPKDRAKVTSLKELSQLLKKDASREQATILEMKGYRHKESQIDERVEEILKREGYKKIIVQTGNSQGILVRKVTQNEPEQDSPADAGQ